jgi:flagellar motility protein MotE (MotC chaperone)
VSEREDSWVGNYFNYFTEVEEHFQRVRGTSLFLLSPLDWALLETWKNAGVPLTAVLRGIDAAFEKWRGRKSRTQMVNSLAFCAQAVLTEAQILAGSGESTPRGTAAPPFPLEDLRSYLTANAEAVRGAGFPEIATALDNLAGETEQHYSDLEQLEQRLTALEEKLIATVKSAQTEDELFASRRELDAQLRPYRGKMTADQLSMLERQYLERRLLDRVGVPRLSLFYMR